MVPGFWISRGKYKFQSLLLARSLEHVTEPLLKVAKKELMI